MKSNINIRKFNCIIDKLIQEERWEEISEIPYLSMTFIKKHRYNLFWALIFDNYKFSVPFLEDFISEIYGKDLSDLKLSEPKAYESNRLYYSDIKKMYDFQNNIYNCKLKISPNMNSDIRNYIFGVIAYTQNITPEFIDKYSHLFSKQSWGFISSKQKLSIKDIKKYKDNIIWDEFWWNKSINDKIISEFKDKVNWEVLFKSKIEYLYNPRFIKKYYNNINWKEYSEIWSDFYIKKDLSKHKDILLQFKEKIIWEEIPSRFLTEDMIRKCIYFIPWNIISMSNHLSDHFINQYKHKIKWKNICSSYYNEEFIIKYDKYIDFKSVTKYIDCKYSNAFINAYFDKFNYEDLYFRDLAHKISNENLIKNWDKFSTYNKRDIIQKISEQKLSKLLVDIKIDIEFVFRNKNVSLDMIKPYIGKFTFKQFENMLYCKSILKDIKKLYDQYGDLQ